MSPNLRVLTTPEMRGAPCTVDFEGRAVEAFAGEPLAVSLFAAGIRTLARSPKFHRPRGAFCFDGHCGSCLMRVDGNPNVRACLTPVRDGMRCAGQNAFPSTDFDALAVADWMFPGGMDHHTLMTGNRLANRFMLKLVRQMGGSGTLPDAPPEKTSVAAAREMKVDVIVVGAGPAGLSAAAALASAAPSPRQGETRLRVLLVDEQLEPGGSWIAEPGGHARARARVEHLRSIGVEVLSRATAIGYFPEDRPKHGNPDAPPGVLAVLSPTIGLLKISARRFLYATGAYDQNLVFADNDRPGVVSARACGRLAFRHGIRPGKHVAIAGDDDYGCRLADGLLAAGVPRDCVERIPRGHSLVGVRGATRLRAVRARGEALEGAGPRGNNGETEWEIAADVLAVAAQPAPASELPRQHGAAVMLDLARGGFVPVVDAQFQTTAAHVFACGDVTGYEGPAHAERAGRAAGDAVAHTLEEYRKQP